MGAMDIHQLLAGFDCTVSAMGALAGATAPRWIIARAQGRAIVAAATWVAAWQALHLPMELDVRATVVG